MEMFLTLMGAALGLLVPYLFMFTFNKGIYASPFEERKKVRLRRQSASIIWGWTALVWLLSIAKFFNYQEGDVLPRFLFPLVIPVLVGVALLAAEDFRTVLDHIPIAVLAGVQTFRFAGVAFIMIAHLGILPLAFASGGYGDIMTGALAASSAMLLARQKNAGKGMFLALSAVGLIDLLNVAFLLLTYYPIWYSGVPNSAPAADFSLIMIPALAAPVALLLHFYGLRNFVLHRWTSGHPFAVGSATAGMFQRRG